MTLEELYKDRGVLARRIRPYVHNDDALEDIIQEAFLKAFTRLDTYDKERASIKTWFNKILFSCVWDYKRSQKKEVCLDIDDLCPEDEPFYTQSEEVSSFLKKVKNDKHWKVLFCYFVLGLTDKESGYVTGTSEGNVRKIVQRFRETEK